MVSSGNRRLAAVFFSDLSGYSRQMDADETAMFARLHIHNAIMDEQITGRGGRVINLRSRSDRPVGAQYCQG